MKWNDLLVLINIILYLNKHAKRKEKISNIQNRHQTICHIVDNIFPFYKDKPLYSYVLLYFHSWSLWITQRKRQQHNENIKPWTVNRKNQHMRLMKGKKIGNMITHICHDCRKFLIESSLVVVVDVIVVVVVVTSVLKY